MALADEPGEIVEPICNANRNDTWTVGLIYCDDRANEDYTLFAPMSSASTYLIDAHGREIHSWTSSSGLRPGLSAYMLEDGDLLRTANIGTDGGGAFSGGGIAGKIERLSWDGQMEWEWYYVGDSRRSHHDIEPLPNGNFLLMSSENRVIDDWPANYELDGQTEQANVIGDVIIEMTRAGDVIREWKLHDILDPYRLGYNSRREDYWANHYDGVIDGIVFDWTHGNAIIYEEEDNSFVMSVPYQDAIIKVSMETGELVWILGNHDNWNEPWSDKLLMPVGDVGWSYKHHAISHTEHGTYLLFDNGVARSSPPDARMSLEDSYSRAVEYAVNEETMEVEQVWVYGPDDEHFYGRYLGDIDWHPDSDTILINIGGRETDADGVNAPPGMGTQRWASLIEVTHEQPAQKVWQMDLKQDDSNWAIYRADRIPSVYE